MAASVIALLGKKRNTAVGLHITFVIGNKMWLCGTHELLLVSNWPVFGNVVDIYAFLC